MYRNTSVRPVVSGVGVNTDVSLEGRKGCEWPSNFGEGCHDLMGPADGAIARLSTGPERQAV